MLYDVCDLATEILASGRLPNDEERTSFRSEAAFAGRMFTQAVSIVWDAGGGAVIYDQNPLSQAFRDANAAARHLLLLITCLTARLGFNKFNGLGSRQDAAREPLLASVTMPKSPLRTRNRPHRRPERQGEEPPGGRGGRFIARHLTPA
jgi:Acyl-CoA dehydrogenase, C-terminal domain